MIDGKVTASLSVADAAITVDSGPGAQTATFQFTGTWSGTITFEANVDEGASPTWAPVKAAKSGTTTYATTTTSSGIYHVAFGAARSIRARFSTATSGTVVATARISPALLITESAGGGGGGGAVTVASPGDVVDGAIATLGTTTDAGVTTDTTGTVIGFLRGNIIKWVSALTQIGIVTEAAPANDTASSGLNGRLQRIAQRITSLIALVPAALTGSGNFKVSVAESTATVTVDTELTAAALDGDTFDIAATALPKVGAILHAMSAGGTLAGRVLSHTSALDGKANTLNGLLVMSVPFCRNAANTNDAQRGINAATATTGTGLAAAAPALWDTVGATNYVRQAGDASGRAQIVGTAAGGAAVSGNPVFCAFADVTGATVRVPVVVADNSDAAATGTLALLCQAHQYQYDGVSARNRVRNNADATLLASGARTTTQTSADITTYNAGAITVTLDMTVVAASPSVTITINGKDPASGKYFLLLSGAAVVTAVTNTYVVDPSVPAVANVSAQKRLPRIIQIVVTANNANSGTYSVGYTLQPC